MGKYSQASNPLSMPPIGTWMMWMLGVKEEGDPSLVDDQAAEIADANFSGVLIIPRGGRLDLRDLGMIEVLDRASSAAKSNNLAVWLMADPRLASESLIAETGEALEILIINRTPDDHWNGENLNTSEIVNGSFAWEMEYPNIRPTHMLQCGGITYQPVDIEKVFAFKRSIDGSVDELAEITDRIEWSHDPGKHLVQVTGDPGEDFEGWDVIAFPRFLTNFYDYTSEKSWRLWEIFINELFRRIDCISGISWDEPGFYAESGKFPAGFRIRKIFQSKYGYDINDQLAWLVLDSNNFEHVRTRNDYFQCLNGIVTESMRRCRELSIKAAAKNGRAGPIQSGIHATWHGEFCGLEEMNHGSLDVFQIRPHQSAAFTDIGGAERLINPDRAPDVIYSLVLARSLSRVEPNRGLIYSNLWGVDFGKPGDGAGVEILAYWRDLLDLFGARWLAHGYGNPNTRFKNMGFGPGYPDHPAWDCFESLNADTMKSGETFEAGEQISDVLVVFPLESFYAIGHQGGNKISMEFVRLIDTLTRGGYQTDLVTSDWLAKSEIEDGKLTLNGCDYNSIIIPHCHVIHIPAWETVQAASEAGIAILADLPSSELLDPSGEPVPNIDNLIRFDLLDDPMKTVRKAIPPTFNLPNGAIGNIRRNADGFLVHLIADRPFGKFSGIFSYSGIEIDIEDRTDPLLISLESYAD